MEVEIISTHHISYGAVLEASSKAVIVIPDSLTLYHDVPIQILFRNGEAVWQPLEHGVMLCPRHLPHFHKSRPIDRLCKSSRSSYGFGFENPKVLCNWIRLEGYLTLYYRPRGFEFENEPRYGFTLSLGEFRMTWSGKPEDVQGFLRQLSLSAQTG